MANKPYRGVTTDDENIVKALTIGPDISMEMSVQAAVYSRYAIAAVWAKDKVERLKLQLEVLEAGLDSKARTALMKAGEKIREASVEALVHSDKNWQNVNNQVLQAKTELGILDAAARAFEQRAMMLSGLGAIKRQEMGQELSQFTKNQAANASERVQRQFSNNQAKGSKQEGDGW